MPSADPKDQATWLRNSARMLWYGDSSFCIGILPVQLSIGHLGDVRKLHVSSVLCFLERDWKLASRIQVSKPYLALAQSMLYASLFKQISAS